jgi:hypothetical protein
VRGAERARSPGDGERDRNLPGAVDESLDRDLALRQRERGVALVGERLRLARRIRARREEHRDAFQASDAHSLPVCEDVARKDEAVADARSGSAEVEVGLFAMLQGQM